MSPFARYVARETLGLTMMGVALFVSAGDPAWWQAWAALAVMLFWIAAMATVMLLTNRELLAERLGPRKGAKRWDVAIMSALGVAQLLRYVLAGLDQRFSWSGRFSIGPQIVALGICVFGYCIFIWAVASNAFFSQVVRIQPERGHEVSRKGPYRYIRHPSYAGAILFEIAVAVLLSSWWALLAGLICSGLLFLRTALEDRTLQKELVGYGDYTREVRYRLVPGIW